MVQDSPSSTSVVAVTATPLPQPASPPWFAQALLLTRTVSDDLRTALARALRIPRGRAGLFGGIDVALVLFLYALSHEPTLEAFYASAQPFSPVLAGFWNRATLLSRSALSRSLAALPDATAQALEELLFAQVLAGGLSHALLGGIRDRVGTLSLCFDLDGTRQAARQRALGQSADEPPPRRRLAALCAPGYPGRKRGETLCTRSVLLQSHTQEWLGTWLSPGNGQLRADLDQALVRVVAYLQHHGLAPGQGFLRLDGAYGTLPVLCAVAAAGVGWLARCSHYAVLKTSAVQAALARGPVDTYTHPDASLCRELFDLPDFTWTNPSGLTLTTRLIVLRYASTERKKPKVGVYRNGYVYELLVTDRPVEGFTAADIVQVYGGRGGFERRLAEEDEEQSTDRFVSHHRAGQQVYQVVQQWVWNLRLWLGCPEEATVREWELSPAEAVPPPGPAGEVAASAGRSSGKYGGADFRWVAGELECPAGARLQLVERHRLEKGVRRRYQAPAGTCQACSQASRCWGGLAEKRGRRVSVWEYPERRGQPGGGGLWWLDVPGRAWRTRLQGPLSRQRVEIQALPPPPAGPPPRRTRAQRAHRRLTWAARDARNALAGPRWRVLLHGIPEHLCQWLRSTQPIHEAT